MVASNDPEYLTTVLRWRRTGVMVSQSSVLHINRPIADIFDTTRGTSLLHECVSGKNIPMPAMILVLLHSGEDIGAGIPVNVMDVVSP